MARRTYEVVPCKTDAFVEPVSFDDAVKRKDVARRRIEEIQAELSRRNFNAAGRRMSPATYQETRTRLLTALNTAQQEIREVKVWLAKNGGRKPSEWVLLAKAYRLLDALGIEDNKDIEALLDEIEYAIPRSFLDGNAEGYAQTG